MKTRNLVLMALLIALHIVLAEGLAIRLADIKISLSFIPLSIMAMLFGPIYTAIGMVVSDVLGLIIFPPAGPPFIGFTISSGLTGFIYGFFLYKKKDVPKKIYLLKIICTCLLVNLFVNSILNTYWLTFFGTAFWATLPLRVGKNIIFIFIQGITIYFINPHINYKKILNINDYN
ncbi:MAG: folate family ECF transporter S component [Lachnospirales bacterium]